MTFILTLKLLIVVFFLVMFLRRPTLVWGIGLLTVTTAVLLDTFLGTFGQDDMLAQIGFFYYIFSGGLFAGAAVWLFGLLRPITITAVSAPPTSHLPKPLPPTEPPPQTGSSTAFDRQMLYNEIRTRLGREDVLDLLFDLSINENDVMTLDQDMNQLIVNLMDTAQQRGQNGALALAVERILTPPPPENLPRLEKITADSPPTILRHYLLAHHTLAYLQQLTTELGIDWEQLAAGGKKDKVRALLLHLYRRNRVDDLVQSLKLAASNDPNAEQPHENPA